MTGGPRQTNATSQNPNNLPMRLAARYTRDVGASLIRAWENVRDWEHLPWLHAKSFSQCRLEKEGEWGWRAATRSAERDAPETIIELVIDAPASRYVSRTLEGPLPGVEIWTQLTALEAHLTWVDVEFHLPHLTAAQAEKAGRSLIRLYTKLWDEDEAMMIARQEALDARTSEKDTPIFLGSVKTLKASLPRIVECATGPIRIIERDGALVAYPARCPHMKAPLTNIEPDKSGCITCPWHGYRFNVETGISADDKGLKLGRMPKVEIDRNNNAVLVWP